VKLRIKILIGIGIAVVALTVSIHLHPPSTISMETAGSKIRIDPAFPNAREYSITISPGIGNGASESPTSNPSSQSTH
jgi:hypothetical protein